MHMRKDMRKDHISENPCSHRALCIFHNANHRWSPSRYSTLSFSLFVQAITEQRQFLGITQVTFCFFQKRESFCISWSLKQSRVLRSWTAAMKRTVWRKADVGSLPDTEETCDTEEPAERQRIYLCCTVYDFLLDDSNERVNWKMNFLASASCG